MQSLWCHMPVSDVEFWSKLSTRGQIWNGVALSLLTNRYKAPVCQSGELSLRFDELAFLISAKLQSWGTIHPPFLTVCEVIVKSALRHSENYIFSTLLHWLNFSWLGWGFAVWEAVRKEAKSTPQQEARLSQHFQSSGSRQWASTFGVMSLRLHSFVEGSRKGKSYLNLEVCFCRSQKNN